MSARTYHLAGEDGLELSVMDRGATWLSCKVPMLAGPPREVLLGCADYDSQKRYIGATVGRYANRIASGRIARDGRSWTLARDPSSPHQLHGGPDGFHRRQWTVAEHDRSSLVWRLQSPDGDQGFPGNLELELRLQLIGPDRIDWTCTVRVDAPCPVAITNHSYFNLDGIDSDARAHELQIAADAFLPVDESLIPTDGTAPVDGTDFDFRRPKPIGADWCRSPQQRIAEGYDHAFLLRPECRSLDSPAATLTAGDRRLRMSLFADAPALQLYAGQHLAGIPSRDGRPLPPCAGVALEPGFLPDSPNHPEWDQPGCWLEPGQTYVHRIRYRFTPLAAAGG